MNKFVVEQMVQLYCNAHVSAATAIHVTLKALIPGYSVNPRPTTGPVALAELLLDRSLSACRNKQKSLEDTTYDVCMALGVSDDA